MIFNWTRRGARFVGSWAAYVFGGRLAPGAIVGIGEATFGVTTATASGTLAAVIRRRLKRPRVKPVYRVRGRGVAKVPPAVVQAGGLVQPVPAVTGVGQAWSLPLLPAGAGIVQAVPVVVGHAGSRQAVPAASLVGRQRLAGTIRADLPRRLAVGAGAVVPLAGLLGTGRAALRATTVAARGVHDRTRWLALDDEECLLLLDDEAA